MKVLNRKLLRDLFALKAQVLAIALVITGGIATWMILLTTVDSLAETRDNFYRDYRFASIFVSLERAPEVERSRIESVSGVRIAESRVRAAARLDVADFDEPIEAQILSLPEGRQPALNQLYLSAGRLPNPDRPKEVVVVESFAEAHGLKLGDRIESIVRGREFDLVISGIGLSPEFVYFIRPGDLFPDHQRYGILWMGREALSEAADMDGSFNDMTISIDPDAQVESVIERIDQLLERWGGAGAYARDNQASHRYLSEEMKGLERVAQIVPLIFLGVASFLLSIVIGRIVRMQRDQIAVLKAFGYSNRAIAIHFLLFVLVIVVLGATPGLLIGIRLGEGLSSFYSAFFRFPELVYRVSASIVIGGLALTLLAALVSTFRALHYAFALPPAEAMRPRAPAHFRRTLLELVPFVARFGQPTRMIIRNLERHPLKAFLSILGIALATGILVTGQFQQDTIDYMLDIQFGYAAREDVTVMLSDPSGREALHELESMPGVIQIEPFRIAPVELIAGHRSYRTAIQGFDSEASLHRIVDRQLSPIELPRSGILLTDWLAERMRVKPGDRVELRLLERDKPVLRVAVAGVAREFVGVSAYMEITALNRLLDESEVISGAFVDLDEQQTAAFYEAIHDRPRVAGSSLRLASIESFNETVGETLLVLSGINTLLAGIIAFGVVYNTSRLSLSERGRELASLRVLGFRRREVAHVLLGELAFLTLCALPLGFAIGYGLCWLIGRTMASELYRIPTIVNPDSFAFAAVVVLTAAALSAAAIGRRLYRLDLIAVLKTRE